MAKYGSKDMTMTIEDAPGGTARALTNFTVDGFDIAIESMMEETTALGDEWEEHTPVGMKRVPPFSVTILMDDAANSTVAIFAAVDDGPADDGREVVVGWGGATYTFDVRLQKTTYGAKLKGLQKITADLQPTGALVIS